MTVTECGTCKGWGGGETPHGWLACPVCDGIGLLADGRVITREEYRRLYFGKQA